MQQSLKVYAKISNFRTSAPPQKKKKERKKEEEAHPCNPEDKRGIHYLI